MVIFPACHVRFRGGKIFLASFFSLVFNWGSLRSKFLIASGLFMFGILCLTRKQKKHLEDLIDHQQRLPVCVSFFLVLLAWSFDELQENDPPMELEHGIPKATWNQSAINVIFPWDLIP